MMQLYEQQKNCSEEQRRRILKELLRILQQNRKED